MDRDAAAKKESAKKAPAPAVEAPETALESSAAIPDESAKEEISVHQGIQAEALRKDSTPSLNSTANIPEPSIEVFSNVDKIHIDHY